MADFDLAIIGGGIMAQALPAMPPVAPARPAGRTK